MIKTDMLKLVSGKSPRENCPLENYSPEISPPPQENCLPENWPHPPKEKKKKKKKIEMIRKLIKT